MNSSTIPILVALFIQLALGLVVFQANRQLKSNQSFLLLSAVAAGWLCTLYYASTATDAGMAAFWIREASAFGALNLACFNLLRLSIREKNRNWKEILRQSRIWIVATAAIVVFCQTRFYLPGARLSTSSVTMRRNQFTAIPAFTSTPLTLAQPLSLW